MASLKFPRIKDPLLLMILLAVLLAVAFPAQGDLARGFDLVTKLAIGLLFFLYGARLSPQEALAGLKNWRLHGTILAFTYLISYWAWPSSPYRAYWVRSSTWACSL